MENFAVSNEVVFGNWLLTFLANDLGGHARFAEGSSLVFIEITFNGIVALGATQAGNVPGFSKCHHNVTFDGV